MDNAKKIQVLKQQIVRYAAIDRWNQNSHTSDQDNVLSLCDKVADAKLGFASDVAATVAKYKKASEKQAYVIAKAAVDANLNLDKFEATFEAYDDEF